MLSLTSNHNTRQDLHTSQQDTVNIMQQLTGSLPCDHTGKQMQTNGDRGAATCCNIYTLQREKSVSKRNESQRENYWEGEVSMERFGNLTRFWQ